jgi:hypothetical protein
MHTGQPSQLSPTGPRTTVVRRLTWIGSALALLLLAGGLLWLLHPHARPLARTGTPLELLLGGPDAGTSLPAAALLTAVGAVTVVVGVGELAGRVRGELPPVAVLIATVAATLGLMGLDAIVIVGYSLAFLLPFGVIAGIITLAPRRPTAAVVLVLVVVGALALAGVGGFPVFEAYGKYAGAIATEPLRFASTLVLTAFAGVWTLWAAAFLTPRLASVGAFVTRHRVAITIAAAGCAAPYVIARASWLTPWPLFGGNDELFTQHPEALVIGLMLGGAMLAGGVLTTGLILPWGSRVPRWAPFVAGRPVPIAVAVVPAATVSLLFTTGGIHAFILALDGTLPLATAFMLPFWLWGPLLGLATWGYARHRGWGLVDAGPVHPAARPRPDSPARVVSLTLPGGAGQGTRFQGGGMAKSAHTSTHPASPQTRQLDAEHERIQPNRLTVAAAISLLVITLLHTLVFSMHQWWMAWLAGPFRADQLPTDAVVYFWGLPGGFVVPGVLLALVLLKTGQSGNTAPTHVGVILGLWALVCVWMVGPSGFLLLLVPSLLLLIAARRSRRRRA